MTFIKSKAHPSSFEFMVMSSIAIFALNNVAMAAGATSNKTKNSDLIVIKAQNFL